MKRIMEEAPTNDPGESSSSVKEILSRARAEVGKVIIGQEDVIDFSLIAIFTGNHILVEGVPGVAKTLLVRTLARVLGAEFSRIQFSPDLMPSDITGTELLHIDPETSARSFRFDPGPIFCNVLLADEINRTPPKTQAALLEAMEEGQVTTMGRSHRLPPPFFVLATQNPIEQEGTYPLPEAQLDRFLFKVIVGYPEVGEYKAILDRTTGAEVPEVTAVSSGPEIIRMREIVRSVPVPEAVQMDAIHLVVATQPGSEHAPAMVGESVALGSSPRGAQGLILAGKVNALLAGRYAVASEDLRAAAHDVLRHRVIVNFHGQSEGVTPDAIVDAVLSHVKPPAK